MSQSRGFGHLPCPKCGEEAIVQIDLDDLNTCKCGECEEEFTTEDVRNLIAKWSSVLAWIDTAPILNP